MKKTWKKLHSKIAYRNPWFFVRDDAVIRPDGKNGTYSVVETRGPSVFVVAVTEKDEVYLIRQYRYPTQMFSWEVPAGNSDGENLLKAAKRELKEETGLEAKKWQEVGRVQSMNGICNEIAHGFLVRNLMQSNQAKKKGEGISQVKKLPLKTVFSWIKTGKITDGQSISALTLASFWIKHDSLSRRN